MNKGLLDFLQSASNAVASNVSGPIDLIGMGLNKIGVPVGSAPVGGTDWMKSKGLMRDVEQGPARVMGETAGLLGPALATKFAPQIARGLLQGGENLAAPRRLNKEAGAIVWHGSPHKFDKFDSSKIGTGEGAQAYGHGLYLAESPDVARQYQSALSSRADTKIGDIPISASSISDDAKGFVQSVAAKLNRGKSIDEATDVLRFNIGIGHPQAKAMQEALEAMQSGVSRGSLYKVDLPDDAIAKMLDWDKPLSQQAPEVQSVLSKVARMDATGEQAWKAAVRESGNPFSPIVEQRGALFDAPEAAAKNLQRLGIPGIRYLDGGSRGAGGGTSNFVVFPGNEGLLSILERNGQAIK